MNDGCYTDQCMWYVYIAQCRDTSLYTGITTDITRREKEHNSSNLRGAKSLRGKRPVSIVYWESCQSESEAKKREAGIKRMNRAYKLQLLVAP